MNNLLTWQQGFGRADAKKGYSSDGLVINYSFMAHP